MSTEVADTTNLSEKKDFLVNSSSLKDVRSFSREVFEKFKIKLIYFSTNYVYPGKKGNYRETDPLLPINSYAWSKLGGECSVKLYKNSLIVRLCMCEKPFIHKAAFDDFLTNFINSFPIY